MRCTRVSPLPLFDPACRYSDVTLKLTCLINVMGTTRPDRVQSAASAQYKTRDPVTVQPRGGLRDPSSATTAVAALARRRHAGPSWTWACPPRVISRRASSAPGRYVTYHEVPCESLGTDAASAPRTACHPGKVSDSRSIFVAAASMRCSNSESSASANRRSGNRIVSAINFPNCCGVTLRWPGPLPRMP